MTAIAKAHERSESNDTAADEINLISTLQQLRRLFSVGRRSKALQLFRRAIMTIA